jgi:hypothetical protein
MCSRGNQGGDDGGVLIVVVTAIEWLWKISNTPTYYVASVIKNVSL